MGWSDLGWAMGNLWAVSMGRQFFCMSTVGPPNKNPCMSTSNNINNKSKKNYPNYQMQEVVESQQIQPTGEQLSINVLSSLVELLCQYSAMYIYNVHTCKFFLL